MSLDRQGRGVHDEFCGGEGVEIDLGWRVLRRFRPRAHEMTIFTARREASIGISILKWKMREETYSRVRLYASAEVQ